MRKPGCITLFIVRCAAWIKSWGERQKIQETEVPTLALRKQQNAARPENKDEQAKAAKGGSSSLADKKKPPVEHFK